MTAVAEGRPAAARQENSLAFVTLIRELSSKFISLPPGKVNGEIEGALRRVCRLAGIDLAVLWQWPDAVPDEIAPTHAYYVEGGSWPLEPMRQEHYPWTRQQLLEGRVVAFSSLEGLPAEAAVDREACRLSGIQSALCLPLSVGGKPSFGALGLALRAEFDWPDAMVNLLHLVAQIFANALARGRRENRLEASEALMAAGAEMAGLAFYEVDFVKGAVYVDNRFRDLCGVPPERERGLGIVEFWMERLHPDDLELVMDLRRRLHEGSLMTSSGEYRFLHPAHGMKWIAHEARIARRDATGQVLTTFGVLRDVTAHKRAENELRELSQRMIRAHEDERALLARELHDDVSQRLAVLSIEVGRAALAVPDTAQAATMRAAREELTRLSEDVHSLAYQLHPSVLAELGLVEALRAECERRNGRGPPFVSADLDPLPDVVGKDQALCLFRVAQEALNNVIRHAGAHTATVRLRPMDGGLLLAVSDDGVGFDPGQMGERMQLGVVSMRERVRLVNGTFDIESAPGRGTVVVAWVPAHSGEGAAP